MFRAQYFVCLALLAALAGSQPAFAAPPTKSDIKAAKQLSVDAQKALKKGDFGRAISMLEEAEQKVPSFEAALALAKAQETKGDLVEAWRVGERAKSYGVPPKLQRDYDAWALRLEQALYQEHAFLTLELKPSDALVREKTDGQWTTPHRRWVKRSFSTLRIEAPGYIPATVNWHHPAGHPATKTVELVPAAAYGRIKITGSPAGALILVDESALGALPSAETRLLAPGKYTVKVEKDKYLGQTHEVTVTAGGVAELAILLEEAESSSAKLLKSKKLWGWTSIGIGGASLITSGVLLGLALEKQSALEDLNATHSSGYEGYSGDYDGLSSDLDSLQVGGYISLGVGLAFAGLGTALLVVDAMDSDASTDVSEPSLLVVPSLMGGAAMVRF